MGTSLTIRPNDGEMLKPAELIELRGVGPLTLHDRRVFNSLIEAAWGPDMAVPGREFTVPTASLKHSDEPMSRLAESIERLMQTVVIARTSDGGEMRFQLLGANTIRTTANAGTLTYSFWPQLAALVRDSSIFAKLDHAVMRSFSSKYAFALYEAVARRARLRHVFRENFTIDGIRDLLGVEAGKLVPYKNLKTKAIEPAVVEVNALTPYQVTLEPRTEGRKVVGFIMGWGVKDETGMRDTYAKIQQAHTGRKDRVRKIIDAHVINNDDINRDLA